MAVGGKSGKNRPVFEEKGAQGPGLARVPARSVFHTAGRREADGQPKIRFAVSGVSRSPPLSPGFSFPVSGMSSALPLSGSS